MNDDSPANNSPSDNSTAENEVVNGEVSPPHPQAHDLAVADDVMPDALHIMPIATRPYFPGQVQPVVVNMAQWQACLPSKTKNT